MLQIRTLQWRCPSCCSIQQKPKCIDLESLFHTDLNRSTVSHEYFSNWWLLSKVVAEQNVVVHFLCIGPVLRLKSHAPPYQAADLLGCLSRARNHAVVPEPAGGLSGAELPQDDPQCKHVCCGCAGVAQQLLRGTPRDGSPV
jgi:hypothetical protein